jgi:hypothetical protein
MQALMQNIHYFFSSFVITEKIRNIFVKFTDINVYEYPSGASEGVCTQTDRRTARVISTGAQHGDTNRAPKRSSYLTVNTQDPQIQEQDE